MRYHSLLFVASFLCMASLASSGPITYDVTVNSSSISGTMGSLDFQFNPGPLVSEPATLQILNFASNGTLNPPPAPTGDVTGVLPGTLSFDNLTAFNDYFEPFTYGTMLSFDVSISSMAGGTSGSAFAFSMFSDAAGTIPALTTDTTNGFAFTVGVNLDRSTTVTPFSSQTTVVPAVATVPESDSLTLVGTAIALMGALLWFRRGGGASQVKILRRI
jgi:hypothetical protein